MTHWRDKVAIVTGASSGFGYILADELRAAGSRVVITARSAGPLDDAAEKLRAAGGDVHAIAADATDDAAVARVVSETIARHGRIDCLVNNAGRSMRKAVLDTTVDEFREQLEVNLLGVVRATRAAAPHLLASRGHLVNISSLAGRVAARWLGGYPASKFAVSTYTQQLRLELGPQGLHVLLVCPGPIARGDAPARRIERDRAEDLDALPASARKPGGGVKTSKIDPRWLARRVLVCCERRRPELVVPRLARLVAATTQLSPPLGDWLIRKLT